MNFRLIALLTIFSLSTWADSPTDSLLAELVTAQGTKRVDVLNQLGEAYRYQEIEKADQYLDSALRFAESIDYPRGIGQAHLRLGGNAIIKGATEAGIYHTQKALSFFEALNDQEGIANANKNLGILAYYRGDNEAAKRYYRNALKIFQEIGDTRGQAKCYANTGLVWVMQGEYDQALGEFMKSLRCNEQLNDQEGVGSDYVYLAQVYQHTNDLAQALRYQKKALAIFKATNNQIRQSMLLSDIGKTYHQQQGWEQALGYYRQALTLQKRLGNERERGTTLGNIGAVYEELQQPRKARAYYQQSLAIARKVGNERNVPVLLRNLAELALQQRAYDTAVAYLAQTITLSQKLGHKSDLQQAYHLLYRVYEAQENYRQALRHYQISQAYQDSLFSEEKSKQMAEMQTRYEVEKKEQQIAAQAQEISLLARTRHTEKRLRLVLMTALGLLFLLILFVYRQYRLKQRSAQLLDEKNREIEAKNGQISQMNQELEKRMLRAQMDPHFIFNSLNAIQHFITTNDKTSALKYLSKFSKLVRRVLENSVNTQVPLADEITLLKHYIELERLRYSHPFDYVIQVDELVDVHDTEIPFLLIQPYVENALVHGLRPKAEGGQVRIEIKRTEQYLVCVVEDNGIGRAAARQRRQQSGFPSRGMSVSRQRLETLNYGKAEMTSIRILDLVDQQGNSGGTRVEILVPQNEASCLVPSL